MPYYGLIVKILFELIETNEFLLLFLSVWHVMKETAKLGCSLLLIVTWRNLYPTRYMSKLISS